MINLYYIENRIINMDQRTILEVILGVYKLDKKYRTNLSL